MEKGNECRCRSKEDKETKETRQTEESKEERDSLSKIGKKECQERKESEGKNCNQGKINIRASREWDRDILEKKGGKQKKQQRAYVDSGFWMAAIHQLIMHFWRTNYYETKRKKEEKP